MNYFSSLICIVLVALCCGRLRAEPPEKLPLLHPLFCDHAVLQRDARVPVWGWTEPGAQVAVTFAGQTRTAVAGPDGKWLVKLKPMRASSEPRVLTVISSADNQAASASDVLVGDVWLCSGQSNMEMGVLLCDATNDIAAAEFPNLRLLTVPHRIATDPVQTLVCRWLPCRPDTVKQGGWGGFSATAFYFGRELQRELNVPIGLLHSSWGGTVAEAWTSAEALAPLGDFQDSLIWVRETAQDGKNRTYDQAYEQWCLRKDEGTRLGWQKSDASEAGWEALQMPQPFERVGLDKFDGIVWFRREFDLPEALANKELRLDLGAIDDFDTAWINGIQVGQTYHPDRDRSYPVPVGVAKPGRNVIALRVLDTGGLGGLMARPEQLRISAAGDSSAGSVALAGSWRMHSSLAFSRFSSPPPRDFSNPNVATLLYNGMIAPLVPFALKGAIWYQGEANADRARQYRRLLPAMIADWRARFGVGEFPFYIVSLAAFQPTNAAPRDDNWAELREAQAMTAKNVRNAGLAVAIDVGDARDIHPKDKQSVGHRLALNALAKTYGKKVENSGPQYRSMQVSGPTIRLKFDHAGGGLVSRGGRLTGFAIAGQDRKFVWAEAVIKGDTVSVSSPDISKPVAVRYAWDINPVCNLYNRAGLPAVPFRTDDWPGITR